MYGYLPPLNYMSNQRIIDIIYPASVQVTYSLSAGKKSHHNIDLNKSIE